MRDRRAVDALLVAVLFGTACAVVRARGFDHVSDDDFARVTIAQAFAHAPKLDPSGTSWLPFPFWALGTVMAVAGRSLAVARAASVMFAAMAAPLPYLAMRSVGCARRASFAGAALALATPWALWLGASTVPESFTASAAAAGAIAIGGAATIRRALLLGAAAIAVACLSRYEPWPLAPVLAVALLVRAYRERAPNLLAPLAIVVAAPLAWMAWNAHAHGSAVHFLQRVATYRRAVGQGTEGDVLGALVLYPRLFVSTRPELLVALVATAPRLLRAPLRGRWLVPLACALAQVTFLAYGAVKDGAPTHHPQRALLLTFVVVACASADALASWLEAGSRTAAAAAALTGVLAIVGLRPLLAPPGSGESEDRRPQIARGRELAGAPSLVVTPCAYEHFALVAAYGAPERVVIAPKTDAPVTATCPAVEMR